MLLVRGKGFVGVLDLLRSRLLGATEFQISKSVAGGGSWRLIVA